jgi:hypothetical protein
MRKLIIGLAGAGALLFAAAAGAIAEKVFQLGVGDVAFIKGSPTACGVANPYKQVACYKHDAKGHAIPGTYGTSLSSGFAALVRFNSKGKAVVVVRKNNP